MKSRAAALALAALLSAGTVACEGDGGGQDSPAVTGDPGEGVPTEPVAPDGGMDAGTSSDAGLEDAGADEGLEGGGMQDGTMQDG